MIQHAFNRSALAVAAVSIGLALSALAQNAPAGRQANPPGTMARHDNSAHGATAGQVSADDRHFAQKAAEAGMGEVAAGKLAQRKAHDSQVKQFAQRMVQDHTQANDRFRQIASSKGIDLPTKLDKTAEQEIDKLEKPSGDDFDRAYIKAQVSDHKKVIEEFQKQAKSGKDADLRNFAQNTLPTLQEHRNLAQSAEQEVIGKSASNSRSSKS